MRIHRKIATLLLASAAPLGPGCGQRRWHLPARAVPPGARPDGRHHQGRAARARAGDHRDHGPRRRDQESAGHRLEALPQRAHRRPHPSTAYRYRVLAGPNAAASDEGHFTTAPSDNRAFKIVIYGDSRLDVAAHSAVVRAIEGVPSDLLLHSGDMVARGDEEDDWRGFFEAESKLLRDRCVFASIGNHELLGDHGVGAAAFLRYFAPPDESGKDTPRLYGSVRWSNTRFFMLNAMDEWTGEQRAWLKEELASRASPSPASRTASPSCITARSPAARHGGNRRLHDHGVLPILEAGKARPLSRATIYAYERGFGGGLKYIVSGGAWCAPVSPQDAGCRDHRVRVGASLRRAEHRRRQGRPHRAPCERLRDRDLRLHRPGSMELRQGRGGGDDRTAERPGACERRAGERRMCVRVPGAVATGGAGDGRSRGASIAAAAIAGARRRRSRAARIEGARRSARVIEPSADWS